MRLPLDSMPNENASEHLRAGCSREHGREYGYLVLGGSGETWARWVVFRRDDGPMRADVVLRRRRRSD